MASAEAVPPTGAGLRESFIHIHIARINDEGRRAEIVRTIEQLLTEVRLRVEDWRPMVRRVGEVVDASQQRLDAVVALNDADTGTGRPTRSDPTAHVLRETTPPRNKQFATVPRRLLVGVNCAVAR